MFDEEKGLFTIGTVSELIGEHPETLRVWEKNGLIHPIRSGKQRKYSNNDIKRLNFIRSHLHEKGLNIAGVKHIINMYPCWFKKTCKGGASKNSSNVNNSKSCWKIKDTFCVLVIDKADLCSICSVCKDCSNFKVVNNI